MIFPREKSALKRKVTANNESVPNVGNSPMNDLPNGPRPSLESLTCLFL